MMKKILLVGEDQKKINSYVEKIKLFNLFDIKTTFYRPEAIEKIASHTYDFVYIEFPNIRNAVYILRAMRNSSMNKDTHMIVNIQSPNDRDLFNDEKVHFTTGVNNPEDILKFANLIAKHQESKS